MVVNENEIEESVEKVEKEKKVGRCQKIERERNRR